MDQNSPAAGNLEGGVADVVVVLVASFSVVFIGGLVREAPARQMSRAFS